MSLSDYISEKPELNTENLILRKLVPEDAADLKEWMPDKNLYTYWGKNAGKSDKNPELLFEKQDKPTKSFHWGIFSKQHKKVVGEFWVYLIENDRMAKVAYRIGNKYQGNGFAKEALSAVIEFCFNNTELKRLWSDVDVNNIASCKVMESCKFKREGLIREGKMVSTWCDYYIYAILKSDFN